MTASSIGRSWAPVGVPSIESTASMPSVTRPNTVCLPSSRGAACPDAGGEVMKHIVAICRSERCAALEILPGKFVVEVKPSGYDKGSGLVEMMTVPPFKGRKPIFIGDDITDHAAFAALPEFGGTGMSVGGMQPGAQFNFDGPQDVRLWIERLADGFLAKTERV